MNGRTEVVIVCRTLPSQRLDIFLRDEFPAVSRGAFQRLIDEGHVRVDGRTVKTTHVPRAGERIEIFWPEARPATAQPQEMPMDVLYEDESLLVINKPPGLVVHPAAGHDDNTLVNGLLHHCQGGLSGIGGVARPGIVHRLDKETSGCLVVAKDDAAHLALSAQFAGRTVEKIYHAIVCGELAKENGEIRAAIARHPSHRKRMAVSDGSGREAHTSYRVLEKLRSTTLVEAILHTGRTHQIRVHFRHLGFPLAGDDTYGQRQNRRLEELLGFGAPRVMLHAVTLAFTHPVTGRRTKFEAPRPADFDEFLKLVR
ncbi:MAG TPA: RluA family pseudouridine synthase [Verrucomicrobiae bacterium]|nr:RluA family pseudouridine synthase [Verrucomicrobiae bacterium]